MKIKVIGYIFLFLLITISCKSKKFSNPFIEMNLDTRLDIDEGNFKIFSNFTNPDELLIYGSYVLSYSNEKILMTIIIRPGKELNKELIQNIKENNYMIKAISLGPHWERMIDFYEDESIKITEYIRDVANDWCTDDFGFFIDSKLNEKIYNSINIYFSNIYSTDIEKGGYKSPWNKEKVMNYKDQKNPGIQFYYMMEKLIKTIKLRNVEKKELDLIEPVIIQ